MALPKFRMNLQRNGYKAKELHTFQLANGHLKIQTILQNGIDKLHEFWPTEVNGVDSTGTLFDKLYGKKLVHDADVEVGKEYYLLKRGHLYSRGSHGDIRIQHIVQNLLALRLGTYM